MVRRNIGVDGWLIFVAWSLPSGRLTLPYAESGLHSFHPHLDIAWKALGGCYQVVQCSGRVLVVSVLVESQGARGARSEVDS